jgi:hypothetical protein
MGNLSKQKSAPTFSGNPPKNVTGNSFANITSGNVARGSGRLAEKQKRIIFSQKIVTCALVFFASILGIERYGTTFLRLFGIKIESACAAGPATVECVIEHMHSASTLRWSETLLAAIVGAAISSYFGGQHPTE